MRERENKREKREIVREADRGRNMERGEAHRGKDTEINGKTKKRQSDREGKNGPLRQSGENVGERQIARKERERRSGRGAEINDTERGRKKCGQKEKEINTDNERNKETYKEVR